MNTANALREVLATAMGIDTSRFQSQTPLFGAIPELDSMAVAEVLMALEQRFGVNLADDDLDATVFVSFASLEEHLLRKLALEDAPSRDRAPTIAGAAQSAPAVE